MYDLAISEHGDLILSGNRDLAGVSGTDLIDQRIKLRLTIHRGVWFFDADGTLGSNLFRVLGAAPQSALEVEAHVREALRPMPEISIEDIVTEYDEDAKSLIVKVTYAQTPELDEAEIQLSAGAFQATTVVIPFTPEGS